MTTSGKKPRSLRAATPRRTDGASPQPAASRAAPGHAPRTHTASRAPASPLNGADGMLAGMGLSNGNFSDGGLSDVGGDIGPLPLDEVFDDADVAQHAQLRELAEIQYRARLANQPEHDPSFDGRHCVECHCDIPRRRLAMGKVRCVDCQEDLDRSRTYATLR